MTSTRVAEAIMFCCLLLIKQSANGYSAGTKFTITPPSKVYATLGSDVHFRWKLSFGNDQDRKDFDDIVWGEVDARKRIIEKYISILKDGKPYINTGLSQNLQHRLNVSVNLTQTACNVEFVLKNFIANDTKITYGCTAQVFGDYIRQGPIRLGIAGYSAGTKFTITPPSKVYATLGSDVHFRWKLLFGNDKDRKDFDDIVWGKVDERNRIIDKYISILKDGKPYVNTGLSRNLQDRLDVSANLTQTACNVEFVLKNVIADDTKITYGCTAQVFGDYIRNGPIRLGIAVSPKIIRPSSPTVDVDEGHDLNLYCKANGQPVPSIAWTKSGKTLQTGNGTNTLQLTNIQRSDGGNYVCTAKNMAGSASFNVLVRIVI